MTAQPLRIVRRTPQPQGRQQRTLNRMPGGGTTGQALTKASGSDYDARWTTLPTATLHVNRGNTAASSTTTTIALADATPAGKEASLLVVIGGVVQDPQYLACDGTTTCTLSFAMPSHTDWFVIHAHPYA